MAYFFINTDWNTETENHVITCDLWFERQMAFAGDVEVNKGKHIGIFKKLSIGDILFMYHSQKDKRRHGGFVGVGKVLENWDHETYDNCKRLLYRGKEKYEYRIKVEWLKDWRSKPKLANEISIPPLFITPGYYYQINESKYKILINL